MLILEVVREHRGPTHLRPHIFKQRRPDHTLCDMPTWTLRSSSFEKWGQVLCSDCSEGVELLMENE